VHEGPRREPGGNDRLLGQCSGGCDATAQAPFVHRMTTLSNTQAPIAQAEPSFVAASDPTPITGVAPAMTRQFWPSQRRKYGTGALMPSAPFEPRRLSCWLSPIAHASSGRAALTSTRAAELLSTRGFGTGVICQRRPFQCAARACEYLAMLFPPVRSCRLPRRRSRRSR
jgi:hypothetical protein